jgi:hypothetical protein
MHRLLDRRAQRDAKLARRLPPLGWTPGPPQFGSTATDDLRRLLE